MNKLKQILEELDEQFLTNPKYKISLASGDEKRDLLRFVSQKIKEVLESSRD